MYFIFNYVFMSESVYVSAHRWHVRAHRRQRQWLPRVCLCQCPEAAEENYGWLHDMEINLRPLVRAINTLRCWASFQLWAPACTCVRCDWRWWLWRINKLKPWSTVPETAVLDRIGRREVWAPFPAVSQSKFALSLQRWAHNLKSGNGSSNLSQNLFFVSKKKTM